MPGGDHTGPWGQGPLTGRAAGYCAGYDRPGTSNCFPTSRRGYGRRFFRRGLAFRCGAGWGNSRMAWEENWPRPVSRPNLTSTVATTSQMAIMQARAEDLAAELKELQQRLALMEKSLPEEK